MDRDTATLRTNFVFQSLQSAAPLQLTTVSLSLCIYCFAFLFRPHFSIPFPPLPFQLADEAARLARELDKERADATKSLAAAAYARREKEADLERKHEAALAEAEKRRKVGVFGGPVCTARASECDALI